MLNLIQSNLTIWLFMYVGLYIPHDIMSYGLDGPASSSATLSSHCPVHESIT